ncbi:MAG: O-acetyl-ADP-ribose deacetylase [Cyanobacteriota bacterium]
MAQKRINKALLELTQGDITHQKVDAIVNAANSGLLGGGGVDGAIHRAGGPKILEECKEIRATKGKCPTGEAVITSAGKLKAKYVIHTVGPIWSGGKDHEPELLANAYRNSLKLAAQYEIITIAFPSISTGVYSYPVEHASVIALRTVANFLKTETSIELVRFVLFDVKTYNAYKKAINNL